MPLILVICFSFLTCHAHESPSHSLEVLNEHIKEESSPELLFQRAMAYKNLGKMELAEADLKAATQANPENLSWQLERCRLQLTRKRPDTALRIANEALKLVKNNTQRGEVHMLRAQAYHFSGKAKPSLHACQLAFKETPKGKLEWYILRSENQYILKLHRQRMLGLKAGLKAYPRSILQNHFVDALIDAEQYQEALSLIEKELPTLRWNAHWQIKQARSLIALDRSDEAQKPLLDALEEVEQRINPARPDILLVADRANIQLLMGNKSAAMSSLTMLRKHRAPKWLTKRIEDAIEEK